MEDLREIHRRVTELELHADTQLKSIEALYVHIDGTLKRVRATEDRVKQLEVRKKKKPKPPTDETVKATVKMTWIVRRLRLIAQDVLDLPNGGSQSQRSIEIYEDCMSLVDNIAKDLPDI